MSTNTNVWTKVKGSTKAVGGYVPPSQRKPAEPTFDEMFPEGLLPVAPVKKATWTSDFKAAIEKKNVIETPDRDDTILYSYTNPITGRTTVLRNMLHHPDDNTVDETVAVPNIVSIMKKTMVKRRILDDDDDSTFQVETESHMEEEHFDQYSEPPEDEEELGTDYVSD